jgi:acyl-CoA thioesterase
MNELTADFANLTGREFLERIWAGPGASPLGVLLNMRLIDVGEGTATFEAIPSPKFYNPQQRCHGGYAAALIDSALGCAVQTKLGRGVGYGTVELKVNYVRPIFEETGRITCTGNVIHFGSRMSTAEARVIDAAGTIYAHGSGTFMVFDQ